MWGESMKKSEIESTIENLNYQIAKLMDDRDKAIAMIKKEILLLYIDGATFWKGEIRIRFLMLKESINIPIMKEIMSREHIEVNDMLNESKDFASFTVSLYTAQFIEESDYCAIVTLTQLEKYL